MSITYGAYNATRVLRFARTPRPGPTDKVSAVQVDHFTKTLSINGTPWVGSGQLFDSDDLLGIAARLPQLVADGITLGVMLTLPHANHSVQSAFFEASAAVGFKIIYPAFITESVGLNVSKDVLRLASEPALLGWYLCGAHVSRRRVLFHIRSETVSLCLVPCRGLLPIAQFYLLPCQRLRCAQSTGSAPPHIRIDQLRVSLAFR